MLSRPRQSQAGRTPGHGAPEAAALGRGLNGLTGEQDAAIQEREAIGNMTVQIENEIKRLRAASDQTTRSIYNASGGRIGAMTDLKKGQEGNAQMEKEIKERQDMLSSSRRESLDQQSALCRQIYEANEELYRCLLSGAAMLEAMKKPPAEESHAEQLAAGSTAGTDTTQTTALPAEPRQQPIETSPVLEMLKKWLGSATNLHQGQVDMQSLENEMEAVLEQEPQHDKGEVQKDYNLSHREAVTEPQYGISAAADPGVSEEISCDSD